MNKNHIKNENLNPKLTALIGQQQEDHFMSERSTENTPCTVWRCSKYHPCRRTTCPECLERRRQYFVYMVGRFATERGLNKHTTITWPLQSGESAWERLSSLSMMLSKCLTGTVIGLNFHQKDPKDTKIMKIK